MIRPQLLHGRCRCAARERTVAGPPPGPHVPSPLRRRNSSGADGARHHDRLVCRADPSIDPALASQLERQRGDHAGILQWPVDRTGRAVVWLDVDAAGGLALGGELEPSDSSSASEVAGLASLLVPAAAAPNEAAIDAAQSLLHLQVRPAAAAVSSSTSSACAPSTSSSSKRRARALPNSIRLSSCTAERMPRTASPSRAS